MRLNKYINEESENITNVANDAAKILEKECQYYLNLLKSNRIKPFYRGIGVYKPTLLMKKYTRTDRRSSGMNDFIFKNLNDYLKISNHTRRDNSVIATSSYMNAEGFGKVYYIFPEGKFNYTWITSGDLNIKRLYKKPSQYQKLIEFFILYTTKYKRPRTPIEKLKSISVRTPITKLKSISDDSLSEIKELFTTNKDIHIAYTKEYEIWFDCKSYYLLEINIGDMEVINRIL